MTDTFSPKIGLALGSGAALGWAHIGIIKTLIENDIHPNIVSGTSIGSMVGGCFAADKLQELEGVARSITWTRMLSFADIQFAKDGFLAGAKVVKELESYLSGINIEDLALPFGAVAVDLIKGEEVIFRHGSLIDAIRASISLPGIFTPVRSGEALLVDGGLMNTVPVSVCQELGADLIIGVNVVADYLGQAESTGLLTQAGDAGSEPASNQVDLQEQNRARKVANRLTSWRANTQKMFRKSKSNPGFFGIGITSAALVMRELADGQLRRCPADFLLEPKVGHIMQVEFNRADELIDIGRQCVEQQLPNLQEFIASKGGQNAK